MYEESIDVGKKDGWRINLKNGNNDSYAAYGGNINIFITLISIMYNQIS